MATNDRCLSLIDKQQSYDSTDNNRFTNLNLNESHGCSSVASVISKSSSNDNKKIINNDFTIATSTPFNDKTDKRLHSKPSAYLNISDFEEEKAKKIRKNKDSNVNNSTLSLHIVAYENAIEAVVQDKINDETSIKTSKKSAFGKTWKDFKQFLNGSSLKNPFDLPRQQRDNATTKPEIMQFKSSQKLLNPNDEAEKENFDSASQISSTAIALTREEREKRMPLKETVQYICGRVEEIRTLANADNAPKVTIGTKDFIQICRFIEGYFINFELGEDFEDAKVIHAYKTQTILIGSFIGTIEKKLPKEILIWIISIYIEFISNRPLGNQLSGKLLNDLFTYAKLLSDNYREKFAEEIIEQWMELLSGSKVFCLNEQWMKHFYDGKFGFDLFPVKILFSEEDNDRKVCVVRCILQLFLYGSFDFSQISDEKLATLYLCLFKDIFDFRISQLSISLLHKFICADLCNGIFLMHTLDTIFSFLDYFHRDPISPGSLEAKEKPLIENAIKSCLDKIASIIILPSPLKQLSLCQATTFLPFAARGIDLLLSFNLENPTILKFVVNSLQNLEATDDLGDFTHLPEDCKKLLRFLIIQCDGKIVDTLFITELFSFLIKFKGVDNTSRLVDNLLESASTNGKKTTEYINVRQTLISVLSPLPNAKQFLSKVVPNEDEILQLFQDLKNATIDTKYLSAYFNIIAKSTDFYTGKPDTLLSFLSLPWICDIGWQIWEDFKKSLPLLAPIKTDEHNYKDLLSTSFLKSISLKALSQIKSKDQWRQYIFKDALYNDEIEVQIAALEALPYLLTTIPTYSFLDVLTPLIEKLVKKDNLAESSDLISLLQSLIQGMSLCICVSGNQYQILPDKQMCCNLCQTKKGNRKTVRITFSNATFDLLTKIVEIEENELIIDFINLLSATVRHILTTDESVEELLKLSLPLIHAGPGIANSYLDFIEEAIKSNISDTIRHSLHTEIYYLQDDLLQLKYFKTCGLHAAEKEFSKNCILEVIGKSTVRTSKSPKAIEIATEMIKILAEKENIPPRTYFIRNFVPFCQYIIKRLLNSLAQLSSDENFPDLQQKGCGDTIVVNCFAAMAGVFEISSSKKETTEEAAKEFLDLSFEFLLPPLFVFKEKGVIDQTPFFNIIFTIICDILRRPKNYVVNNAFPRMLWYLCYHKQAPWCDTLFRRVQTYSNVQIATMINMHYCQCSLALILSMGKNEESAKMYLSKLYEVWDHVKPKTFDVTSALKSNYLGNLLDLRRTFSDDVYYNYRTDIIKSLIVLINNLTVEFFSSTPGRMLTVLKAIDPIEHSLDAWMAFLQRLDPVILEKQIHLVLLALPKALIDLPGAKKVFEYISGVRRKADPKKSYSQRYDQAVIVLYPGEKQFMLNNCASIVQDDKPLICCAKMLMEESPEVHIEVLPKIVALLETTEVTFDIFDELIHALLHALKISTDGDTRLLIGNCIGKIGAIDPGKIGVGAVGDNTKVVDRRPLPLKFVDSPDEFFEEVLEFCAKLLIECADASKVDFIAMATQLILKELSSPDLDSTRAIVEKNLKEETKHEIAPYKTSKFKFTLKDKPDTSQQPYAENSRRYDEWLWKWYFAASDKIRDSRLSRVFMAFQHIYYSYDYRIVQLMLPQVILQGLLENNTSIINEARSEIFGVFRKSLSSDGWIRLAAQTCFQMIEFIEKFEVLRSSATNFRRPLNNERERVQAFLNKVVGELCDGTGELLCVAVAEKYNFGCRALRWLEQYGIKVAANGKVEFNRAAMYALERIYLQLSDTDGVLGAYETIQNHSTASPQERVVAFEATGDHTEALPLYQQRPVQKLSLVKCLLRLNQPLIAYNLAGSFAQVEENEKIKYKLRDYQIEAAYRREEWQNLNEILKDTNEKSNQISSWGAHVASIFAGIHDKSKEIFVTRVTQARMQLMDSLKAVTMEGADTYSQAYRYIQRLHILYEIEDAAQSMKLFSTPEKQNYDEVVRKWDARSANAIQCSSILEPIYWVRRELLRFADPMKNKDKISHYLVESSKYSRYANHLSTSWAHLINARSLEVEKDLEIDMEEAKYFFQRGQKGEAICALQKTLEKNFPQLVHKLKRCTKEKVSEAGKLAKDTAEIAKLTSRQRKDFVKTHLLLTDFMEKSNASNITDIYLQYAFMGGLAEKDQEHSYALALFYDNAYYSRNMEDHDNVLTCLRLYSHVLHLGRRYLLHVMPRMLTIWFDFASAMHEKAQKQLAAPKTDKRKGKASVPAPSTIYDSQKISEFMRNQFEVNKITPFYWFTAYPQLISRLCHPVQTVYKVLEDIMAGLMILYPHECLWQTIASYRVDAKTDHVRFERTRQIIRAATGKLNELTALVKNYNTFAGLLIEVAEDGGDDRSLPVGNFEDFNKKFFKFKKFFSDSNVKIAIPFITMVEKKMPNFMASQITLPSNDDSTVYITGIENKYRIFSSAEKPKLITVIGSNGVRYDMIAKRGDEMRKDGRCLDFCRMINTLLLRDSEARRRQLHIRTYSVIPLQARGGLIEVVPNLQHLRVAFASTTNESETSKKWQQIRGDKIKRKKFFEEHVEKNPVKMAEHLRKAFVDPCKWYAARLAFTRTAATMSMAGFILGLGDRHCENILLDSTNGDVVHVDFNILFNKGEDLPTPEIVPFRLTRNMIDGFGPTGVEGAFRKTCEIVMRVLRREQATLFTVLETFIHDPLLEWRKVESRNQQVRGAPKIAVPTDVNEEESAISLIKARLEGKIVTKRMYPLSKSCITMSVEGQVAQLIKMASDPENLAHMYIGWNPHL